MSRRRRLLLIALGAAVIAGGAAGWWHGARTYRATTFFNGANSELANHHYGPAREYALIAATYWPRRGDVRLLAARACRRAEHPDEAKPHLDAARELLGE